MPGQTFDLAVATDWEQDREFVGLLEARLRHCGRNSYVIWPFNLSETLVQLREGSLEFRFLIDRASTTSLEFLEVFRLLAPRGIKALDNPYTMLWASDKATMHLEFISRGIHTPHTLILPPYATTPRVELSSQDLVPLGVPFVIKPANITGGGRGVLENVRTVEEVLEARQHQPRDKYLLQERILPQEKDGLRFWFRVFHACGQILCTWWDDRSHLYRELGEDQIHSYGLIPLIEITLSIAEICRLRFFSTEIVLDPAGRFMVVDYVNEACDLRLQSSFPDGVPDSVVQAIAERITRVVFEELTAT